MILYLLQLVGILLITVIVHEAGHSIVALLCKVPVKVFSIGFGKPYLKKKFKNIEFRLSPIPLGGYTSLYGEDRKVHGGFLASRYSKKVAILLAGVVMNLIVATISHYINYGNIWLGFTIDIELIKTLITRDYTFFVFVIETFKPNYFLLILSFFSTFSAIFNLIPFPSLDGSWLWMVWLEKKMTVKRYITWLGILTKGGFVFLMVLQLLLIIYWIIIL